MDKLIVSSSPHITGKKSTPSIMADVLIALIFPLIAGVYVFGIRALILVVVSVLSACFFESLWNLILHKENTISDLSACVTGALIAMILPVSVPLFVPVIGSLFAIIIVKQLFGGLGQNFVNPALSARAFLLASWPLLTTVFVKTRITLPLFSSVPLTDAITSATPLNLMKASGETTSYINLFLGNISGCIGETSAVAILIGGVYLVIRKVITLHLPLSYILSSAFFGFLLGYDGLFTGDVLFTVLSGGILFGAFFMITDYVTTPTTKKGQITAGIIAGFITILIRVKGGYPEGVTYAILFVNVITPLIDKYISPKKYGRVAKNG